MKKNLLFVLFSLFTLFTNAQRLLSWTPEFPLDNSTIVITGDANKGNKALLNYEGGSSANVYVHTGVITNLSTGPSDWKYTKFTWGTANPAAHATPLGSNKYSYTITDPRTFFGVPAGETILKITFIFRTATGSLKLVNSDGSDMYIPVYTAGQYAVRLNLPPSEPRYIPWLEPIVGTSVPTTGVASAASALDLSYNGVSFATAAGATTISGTATVNSTCAQNIVVTGTSGATTAHDSAKFYIAPATTTQALPAGVQEGINYDPNNTAVTLVLYAPNKNHVVVIGDFTGWQNSCANQMKRTADGNYYWTTITGLTPGTEYGYQYVVDDTIRIADPYSQKILDPNNDQYIDAITYPNLKPYPTGLTTDMVSVFQPAEPQYNWQVTNFTKPDKRNLMIYELLIRDFTAQHSYQSLIDSIQYLKSTGINAIELMPVNEFDGNESWGYNPDFYFAPDKYYGTKNKLKEFIDLCHQNGIAVILDVVYNHCTGNAPEAKLYWNSATSAPAANNPWLNVSAPHPYGVFNDFNHTSTATQYLVERSLDHWLTEYKVDGYRFDLAKGFTQTVTNTTTVENFDPSRVQNLERYYDATVATHPNTYMILEFLGTLPCSEEQEYAAHGFMLWGNDNAVASQCTMGYTSNSDLSQLSYNSSQRNYNNPASVGYLESHDEERTMYRNLSFGNSSGGYNVTSLPTALSREEAIAAIFFTVPGPKMIWQFEERGYDISIGFGGGNTANKPPHWEYMLDANRLHLYNAYHSMMQFRLNNPAVFNNTTFSYDLWNTGGLYKLVQIADPNAAGTKVTVIANLDVTAKTKTINFQTTGTWANYISNGTGSGLNGATGSTFNLASTSQSITLQPGEYHIYYSGCGTPAPTATSPVNYCQNATAVPLTATGTGLLWYTVATGGTGSSTAPTPSTATAGSTTYYVSQTISCEGPRSAIIVNVAATPAAPTVTSPVSYCQNTTASQLTATGSGLLWYTAASGGTGSATAPTPSTTTVGSTIYYISQTVGTCESPRASITVNVTALPGAPGVTTPVTYCQNATSTALTATGTNLRWYTVATGGVGSATAPTPSTTTAGSTLYYVSQTVSTCEGPRAAIIVTVNAIPSAPTVTTPVTYCQNATATPLTATGSNLLWYTAATGGTGSSTAPTPVTTVSGSTIYYVSQTVSTCESPRAAITVTINPATPAPIVTSPVTYCQNATASALTATGTSLLWYTAATGGVGSTTAPTPSTTTAGSTIYYVSQTLSCGEGPRAAITVTINALPAAPGVTSPVAYCQNATVVALTATGSNLLWYTTATGGVGSSTAPTPSTTTAGATIYYVSQTVSTCEGPRAAITVNVTATPVAPTVSSPVTYCQNSTATPLTATGTNLLWYTVANGGTGSSTAPTPSTTTIGSSNYYVSQSTGSCEGPRALITVNITAGTPAPTVTSPVIYCQGAAGAAQLTATGTALLWYAAATGGVGSSTAPTPSTATAGSTNYYVSQTQSCGESPRALITVTVNALPTAPGVTSPVAYCQNATATVLTATGTNLLWYTVASGGTGSATAPTPATTIAGSTIYYVSQTVSTCEGPRASITVNVTATPAAPTVSTPVTYCQNTTATPLTATGTNLLWYTVASGGTGSATAPTPVTTTIGSTNYYVSQTTGSCEGPRALITVNITASTPAPVVTSPVAYCQGATATQLTATGTNLLWYTAASGGVGSSTAPTPSTATAGSTIYYVSQTLSCGEGPRAAITVNVTALPAAPGVTSPVAYCQNATATALTATGTNLLWYTVPTGGTGSATAPTPATTIAGSTIYYVSQTVSTCEGPRASITVNVTATPAAPTVSTPVTYCQNTTATALTATGTNLLWYTAASGGTGSSTAPTPSTTTIGSTNYYVSQSTNTCEGPRALITVNITASTPAPVVTSPIAYCQGATAAQLTATGTALLWYAAATGGVGSSTAPTPSTATAGSTIYYVSQTLSCGEGPRAAITVNVTALPTAPGVTSPVAYCQNATATALTASGTNLLWYTVPTGGTGSATAPTPSTTTAGSTIYYVSQTTSSCEGPRAAIIVNVTATPTAPTVSSPVTYCQNTTATPLTATGTNLLWYTAATGGVGSSTAPTPSTTTIGSTNYYVSQSTNTCEGPRSLITVNITASTPAPVVTSPIAYCQGATAAQLTATGTSLLWYAAASGGVGSATAPTPSTATVGSTTYYVSQTLSCGEGPRASITVNVNAIPAAPGVTSPVAYCQNTTAVPLTATGSNLLWYTAPTGGTVSATAPTPSTTTGGSVTYYVSQTTTSCEGPRAAIVVNVTATPAAPTVSSPVSYCQNTTATPLTATGTNLLWYTAASGGVGSATAPTPSTTTVGSTNYYVSQSTNTCEGPRALITVNVTASTPAPTVTSPIAYCQGAPAVPLTATGTALLWYAAATGGVGSATAPTPSTATVGSTTYYVSQTLSCGEGPRASITVNVNAIPAAPGVTSPVAYCQNTTATPLSATGTNLLWYTLPTGGTGFATAPTPSTTTGGSVTYYVSQTAMACEGPRAAIVVNVTATPAAPTVTSPVSYCQNTTATPLSATGTNLLWYTAASGGVGSATAPTPSTTTVGSTNYYVSQSTNTCEGPRALITVNVTASTPAPTVTSPIAYCQGATSVPLTATGTALLWYAAASGGIGSSTAPTPSTATVGSTTYYVSQTLSCGEGPRASITVNVNAIPAAPGVTSPVAYCQNTTATPLAATGSNLLWYTAATGGTGSATAPTPSTTTAGSVIYYVSQTTTSCEGPRAAIVVNTTATPLAPTVTSPITYCQNTTATALTATGTNLLWYTTATGGTGSATAPTPSTATAGSTNYYVSQSTNTCEGPRAVITVNITASTPAPTVTTPVVYCQGTTAVPLTATGTGLLWYTAATGGVGSSTAPTPSTAAAGSTIYYVSQTLTCGEGPRAAITVTVNPTPGAPAASPISYCQNSTAAPLTATGTNLLWYTAATGGTGSATAPTPATTTVGSTNYYISQTTGTCEGPRAALVVTVNPTPGAPTATSPISYCRASTATPLTAAGTNLLWYTAATGGTGSATAPTPSTATVGSTIYYVSQTTGTCEGPRAAITVNVTDVPVAPTVTTAAFVYCQNSPATVLSATGTNLLWYTAATGGTGSAISPTPSTATAGTVSYYVSQGNGCGESVRASIAVTVTPAPAAPTGLTATGITANIAILTWTGSTGVFYTVQYKTDAASVWTSAVSGISATTYTLTGLVMGTMYDWRVNANCDAANAGTLFSSSSFTTTSRNNTIPNIVDGIGIKLSPVPVTSSAILDYIVPGNGLVTIVIYDALGREVKQLVNTVQAAGQYQLDITQMINNMRSGNYFIKLRQGSKSAQLEFVHM